MRNIALFLFIAMFVFAPPPTLAEQIIVEGGGAAISEIFLPMEHEYEKATGDDLKNIYSSPIEGLISLEKGSVDLLGTITPLQDSIKEAALMGVNIDPATLVSTQVGVSQVAVFINTYNNIKQLSKQQLKDIFTGKITNWKGVGGDDEHIEVVWEQGNSGVKRLFVSAILESESVTSKTISAKNYYSIRDIVSNKTGAIGIAPLSLKTIAVNTPIIPKMTAPIFAVTKGKPSKKVLRLLDFYKSEYSYLAE